MPRMNSDVEVKERFGLQHVIFVADRGSSARSAQGGLTSSHLDWITALRRPPSAN